MSLALAAQSSVRIGATSSRQRLTGHLRAFQTLSAPKRSTHGNNYNNNQYAGVYDNITMSSTQKNPSIKLSSPTLENAAKLIVQTRSMAGVPESEQFRDGKPTLAYANEMPKTFASMTNEQVLHFAELGIPEACRECIVRDVMVVDQVEYDEAMKVFHKIAATNREKMGLYSLPFKVGLGAAVGSAFLSIPMVFDRRAVEWFGEVYVTADMPDAKDFETWLEVGAASWSWMEPVIGEASFFLLCMQFARAQMQNLGYRPYYYAQKKGRVERLIETYPQYDPEFLSNYSKCDRLIAPHNMTN